MHCYGWRQDRLTDEHSRVDPARIFSAGPGEFFIVRNVANLVPPCEASSPYHSTSAAIEFAVQILDVKNIVVMGHARSCGIRAFLDRMFGQMTQKDSLAERCIHSGFIAKMDVVAAPCLGRNPARQPDGQRPKYRAGTLLIAYSYM